MSTVDRDEATTISWDELPEVVTTYLTANRTRAADTAIGTFTDDAAVTDEGRTYHGQSEIRTWLERAGGGYTFTTEFTRASRIGAGSFDVVQHLEGDFPGGVADLHFRFTLDGTSISRLVIEP